eukprot:CAMPEP_0172510782 /NCGR_PEP_ID=MMETSP1066-20121228/231288_1 /TAXON_ID=671091 /ORGANISM="Coscinodiscus wailesii, Strain CCMP2513" /LENGTH=55 /DNA_ID=CAMNT_0013289907 /DNA_START=74 /DNA_END=238 /DNA_ORIENTATION=+
MEIGLADQHFSEDNTTLLHQALIDPDENDKKNINDNNGATAPAPNIKQTIAGIAG